MALCKTTMHAKAVHIWRPTGVSVDLLLVSNQAPAGVDSKAAAGWVADAKAELGNSWRELADSLHRREAALPSGFALPE